MLVSKLDSTKQMSGPVLISGHTGFKETWLTLMLEKLGIPTCGYSLAPEEKSLYNISNRKGMSLELDSSLAIATLNWKPRWTQEEAIVNTINWWKKVLIEKASPIEVCMRDIESYAEQNE